MALNVDRFTNIYADVYSLGDLRISRDSQLNESTNVENISATLESSGDLTIRAQELTNRSEKFAIGRKLISGYIAGRCNDCGGGTYNVDYVATEVYQGEIVDFTPSAYISSGRDLDFKGGSFSNVVSSVSAARNINIEAREFSNQGASSGVIERRITYNSVASDGSVRRFVDDYLNPYNQRNDPEFPNARYVDSNGNVRLAAPYVDFMGPPNDRVYYLRYKDVESGEVVTLPQGRELRDKEVQRDGGGYSNWRYVQNSEYDPSNLLSLPDWLNRYTLVLSLIHI